MINDYSSILIEPRETSVQIDETLKVMNKRTVLTEIPDKFRRVYIDGYTEIERGVPSDNEYSVNYQNRIVSFGGNVADGTDVNVHYYGKGYIQYPAEAVYSHNKETNIVTNLQQLIDSGESAIANLDGINAAITGAETATNNANTAASNASSKITEVNTKLTEIQTSITNANNATSSANTAATNANSKATLANSAATTAQSKATLADQSATNANLKISEMNTKITEVDQAITNSQTATTNTNTAIQSANDLVDSYQVIGDYNASTTYKYRNQVYYNGSTYMAKQQTTGNVPTNTTYWRIIAQKGLDGTGAVDSVNGKSGNVTLDASDVNAVKNLGGVTSLKSGLLASRPSAGSVNSVYIATDDKGIYRDNGTTWDRIGGADSLDWTKITNKPSTYPPSTHTHSELHTHSNKTILDAIQEAYTTTEKNKLSGIQAGAQVNSVTSVNGQTGAVSVQGFSGNYNDLTNKPTIPTSSGVRTDSATALNVEVRTSDPTSPALGRIWFRSDL